MLEIVLLAGKFILLTILYLFIYRVIRSSTREFRVSADVGGRRFGAVVPEIAGGGAPEAGGVRAQAHGMWTLVVIKSPSLKKGEAFAFPTGSTAVIGRDRQMDISLDDTFVSSKHALVESVGRGLRVEDLHSTNGTLVNGEDIAGVRDLADGDRIEIGDTVFEVEVH